MYDFKKTTWLQGDHLEVTKFPQLLPDKIQFFTSQNDELIFLLLINKGVLVVSVRRVRTET